MRKKISILLLVSSAFLAVNCGTSKTKKEATETATTTKEEVVTDQPSGTVYVLTSMANLPVGKTTVDLFPMGMPTLKIDHVLSLLTGSAGCNNYRAGYKIEGRKFKVDENILMTKKYCQGVEEQFFINELKKANGYAISGENVSLTNNEEVIMTFKKQ